MRPARTGGVSRPPETQRWAVRARAFDRVVHCKLLLVAGNTPRLIKYTVVVSPSQRDRGFFPPFSLPPSPPSPSLSLVNRRPVADGDDVFDGHLQHLLKLLRFGHPERHELLPERRNPRYGHALR